MIRALLLAMLLALAACGHPNCATPFPLDIRCL